MTDGFTCHFLSDAQHTAAEKARDLAKSREKDPEWMQANNATYGWARLSEVVAPCPMWFERWHFDPGDPSHAPRRETALKAIADGTFGERNYYLSHRYWTTWSHVRPPITVLCPNGREWCVDAKSANGDGWTVEGSPPLLFVRPSILVSGYHGFLGKDEPIPGTNAMRRVPGVFTGDIDKRS